MAGDICRQIITAEPKLSKATQELQALCHSDKVRSYVGVRMSPSPPPLSHHAV